MKKPANSDDEKQKKQRKEAPPSPGNRQPEAPASSGNNVGAPPGVEVRHDYHMHAAAAPDELRLPERMDVFRDTHQGKLPVESHAEARPRSGTGGDPAKGYAFGPTPRESKNPGHRTRVMTTGVFDLIHLGHVQMLEAAKALGDELVVVVARDETVRKQKHDPITPEETRRRLVASLRMVDKAVLGRHGDIYPIVKDIRPDIIALGHDQAFNEEEVVRKCAEQGVTCRIVRLPRFDNDLDATRKIVDRIGEKIARKQLYTRGGTAE